MMEPEILNITCGAFAALTDAEQRLFVIGVANGRGMTQGLFQAYAGAAQDHARTPAEREALAASDRTIQQMIAPVLKLEVESLLAGIRAECQRTELRDEFVINALAAVHLNAVRAIRQRSEQAKIE